MLDDLKISSMIDLINNIYERAEESLEIASKYQGNTLQKELYKETSSYFKTISDTVDSASSLEQRTNRAKFTVNRIAKRAFDLVVETQMENFKVDEAIKRVDHILDKKRQKYEATNKENNKKAMELAVTAKVLEVDAQSIFDDSMFAFDEMITMDDEFYTLLD